MHKSTSFPSDVFAGDMPPNTSSSTVVDTLIHARWILPVRPNVETVLAHNSLAIRDGKIIAILPTTTALKTYTASTTLWRPHHVLLPGLINVHTHTGVTLLRGAADDAALHEWLRGRVWPIEAAFSARTDFCFDGALISAAEMTRGGTTTFMDMYWDADASARATLAAGLRAVVGISAIAFPSSFGANIDDYISKGEVIRDRYAAEPRLRFAYAPHAPYTVPDESWKDILARSQASGARIHSHIHETKDEVHASEILDRGCSACHMSDNPVRPLANLDELGVLNDNFIAAHMVHLTDREIALCAERGVHIAHCPSSNAKLASGFCLVKKLLAAGVNIALGTDSACSNNSLDLFAEMKMAALVAKNSAQDATTLPAKTAIEMATINGARALGINDLVGSLEVGKCADVISVELGTHSGNSPVFRVHSAIVYAASKNDVCDVLVDGKVLLEEKKLLKLNEREICCKAQAWADQIEKEFPAEGKSVD